MDSYSPFIGFLTVIVGYLWYQNRKGEKLKRKGKDTSETEYFPPLPQSIVNVLKLSKLCFLATNNLSEPHLSLMNFTYHQEEECLILCTRKNTKKYQQIQENPKIAVLIHDFPHLSIDNENAESQQGKTFSVTLNGHCEIYDDTTENCERYRQIHLRNNPNYSQFICGKDIAAIKIFIEKARICDFNDKVSYWNNRDGITNSES